MTSGEEVACFRARIRRTWQGPESFRVDGVLQDMAFSRRDLVPALRRMPETKAVAPGCAHGAAQLTRL